MGGSVAANQPSMRMASSDSLNDPPVDADEGADESSWRQSSAMSWSSSCAMSGFERLPTSGKLDDLSDRDSWGKAPRSHLAGGPEKGGNLKENPGRSSVKQDLQLKC